MKILALDLGWYFAWATDFANFGSIDLHDHNRTCQARKLLYFSTWINQFLESDHTIVQVWYESPHLRGMAATRSLVGMAMVLEMACYLRNIPCVAIHTATLKVYASREASMFATSRTNGRNLTKADMLKAFRVKFGEGGEPNEHEVDALWLLDLARSYQAVIRAGSIRRKGFAQTVTGPGIPYLIKNVKEKDKPRLLPRVGQYRRKPRAVATMLGL